MKATLRLTAAAFVLAALNVATLTASAQAAEIPDAGLVTPALERVVARYAPGELLVKFIDGPESDAACLAHAGLGAEVQRTFGEIRWQHVKLPDGLSVAGGLDYYQALAAVAAVEPNYEIRMAGSAKMVEPLEVSAVPSTLPNDPQFSKQLNLQSISAPIAWAITTGSPNIVVALLDTGVDYTHEDLAANMWRNPGETGLDKNGDDKATNRIDDDGNGYVDDVFGIDAINHDTNPMDDNGHGTGKAGLIGAVGNNGKGIAGINWTTRIMALKLMDSSGSGPTSATLEAYEYVIQMQKRGINIRVGNNSWLGESGQAVKDAIDAMGNLGILNVFAAGNDGVNTDSSGVYPACFDSPCILSVTGCHEDRLVYNYGRKSVDLAAPCDSGCPTTSRGNGYSSSDAATSAACAHVSGAAALLLAAKPDLSVAELKAALLGTVDLLPAFTDKVVSNGRLNVARAMQFLVDSSAPSIVTSALPCGTGTSPSAQLELTFTKPMDHGSVEAGFSLKPVVTGRFEWSNNDRTLNFVPGAPLGLANYTGKLLGSAKDLSGVTLDGNYNRVAQGTNWDDFTWSFRVAAENDCFSRAEPISGNSGSVTGTIANATKEFGEPRHAEKAGGASIWYRWTAPTGASVTFDATATRLDTLLAVYSGDKLETLAPVASNDNYGTRSASRVTFVPTLGTTYFIALDDKAYPETGNTTLSWYPTPPPVFRSASGFTPDEAEWGAQVTLNGTNFTGVTSVLFGGVNAKFTNNSDLRITASVPLSAWEGPITIQTPHGNVTSTNSFLARSKVIYSVSGTEPALWVDWPGGGFVLQYAESLTQAAWQSVTQTPTLVEGGTRQVVALPFEGSAKFYRWRKD